LSAASAIVEAGGAGLAPSALDRACFLLAEARSVDEVLELRDQAVAMRVYAKQRDTASIAHADAYEIVQRANRRLGELLRDLPTAERARTDLGSTDGTQTKISALRELGIPKVTAHRMEKLAALPEEEFRARIESQRVKITKQADPRGMTATTSASEHDGDAWGTPVEYLAAVRTVFGGVIGLDVATNAKAQERVRAEHFYTREDDGLIQPWKADSLWNQPPFSDPLVAQFCNRFVDQFAAGSFVQGITLVNACTETVWFQRLLGVSAVCFPNKRIAFLDAAGVPVKGNAYRQAVFYVGPKLPLFAKVFGEFGEVLVKYAGAKRARVER
jgi:phage N-6-adenine-methyltransferase